MKVKKASPLANVSTAPRTAQGQPMTDAGYLRKMQGLMREAVKETQKFDARWKELDELFRAKISEENRVRKLAGREPHSVVSIAHQKATWMEMNDTFTAGQWWRGRASYLAEVIQAEAALQGIGL